MNKFSCGPLQQIKKKAKAKLIFSGAKQVLLKFKDKEVHDTAPKAYFSVLFKDFPLEEGFNNDTLIDKRDRRNKYHYEDASKIMPLNLIHAHLRSR